MSESARKLGEQRALLFQGFACFAYEQARALGLNRLHFVTREGVFFKAVFDALFFDPGIKEPPIDSVLVEASRQATFGPSVACSNLLDFDRLWRLYPRMSPLAFMKSLNLDPKEFGSYFERQGLPIREIVEMPSENDRFKAVLTDPGFVDPMQEQLARDRNLAREYFSNYFENQEKVGIVEIGWQGSIQDNLAILFPEKEFHGIYMGLAISKIRAPCNSNKLAFGPDRNLSNKYKKLLDAVNVLEFACLSPGGSAVRYARQSAGEVRAIRIVDETEDSHISAFSSEFQRGVVSGCNLALGQKLVSEYRAGRLQQRAIADWQELLANPQADLVRNYFSLKSNEEFGLGQFRDQSKTPSWKTIILAPFGKVRRSRLIRYLTYSQWAEGMRRRADLSFMKRWSLCFLMRTAIAAKSARHSWSARRGSKRSN